MIVGLLPAIRGGLGELAQTGQHSRLIDGYLVPYAQAFAEVRYFSYLDESLASFTADRTLLERVRVLPGGREHPWRYAFAMARRHGRAMRECSVFRVFQITGVVPALIARRRWGIPFVATYGFHYERLARSRSSALLRRVVARLGVRAAAAVIVPTAELADIVSAQGGAGKIHVVPNGVDTRRFRPAPGPPGGRAILLYVGRLSVEKDLATLLEAAGKLLARFDLAVAMVGEGDQRAALEARGPGAGRPAHADAVRGSSRAAPRLRRRSRIRASVLDRRPSQGVARGDELRGAVRRVAGRRQQVDPRRRRHRASVRAGRRRRARDADRAGVGPARSVTATRRTSARRDP
jgi:glycosyltransferase involved in cell wall biosynthesis